MQERAPSARYRAKDPERANRRVLECKERRRDVIREAKSKPCSDCKTTYPYYVMDFDHVRGDKVIALGLVVAWGYTEQEILNEIAKCDVVCSNCHRERTHARKTIP